MNYAQKELHEVIAYLAEARAAAQALKQLVRTLSLGGAVEISFRSTSATATALCPAELGYKLLYELLEKAEARVTELEEQETYWFGEASLLAQREQLDAQRRTADDELQRTNPNAGAAGRAL